VIFRGIKIYFKENDIPAIAPHWHHMLVPLTVNSEPIEQNLNCIFANKCGKNTI